MTWEKVLFFFLYSIPVIWACSTHDPKMFLRTSVCEIELWKSLEILTNLSRNIVTFEDKLQAAESVELDKLQ